MLLEAVARQETLVTDGGVRLTSLITQDRILTTPLRPFLQHNLPKNSIELIEKRFRHGA